jgi:hypothetical protein
MAQTMELANTAASAATKSAVVKPTFPDFVEDVRMVGERSIVTKYARGKMLGKVSSCSIRNGCVRKILITLSLNCRAASHTALLPVRWPPSNNMPLR